MGDPQRGRHGVPEPGQPDHRPSCRRGRRVWTREYRRADRGNLETRRGEPCGRRHAGTSQEITQQALRRTEAESLDRRRDRNGAQVHHSRRTHRHAGSQRKKRGHQSGDEAQPREGDHGHSDHPLHGGGDRRRSDLCHGSGRSRHAGHAPRDFQPGGADEGAAAGCAAGDASGARTAEGGTGPAGQYFDQRGTGGRAARL